MRVIAVKDNARDAWNAWRTMCVGVERVREAKAQKLCRDFENLAFRDGESVLDFALRLSGVITDLQVLGNDFEDERMVRKFMRVVPARYAQVAISIDALVETSTLSIEEVTGRLLAIQERFAEGNDGTSSTRLLLIEEEWKALQRRHESGEGSSGGGAKPRWKGKGNAQNHQPSSSGGSSNGGGHGKPKKCARKCHNCGIKVQWVQECRKPRRDRD